MLNMLVCNSVCTNTSIHHSKNWCMILNSFFVHIPPIYQISTYTGLYTRIFDFSHFCDFPIPFVYQNNHIPTHIPELLTYNCCIPICEILLFCFLPWSDIFLEIFVVFLEYLSRYTDNVVIDTQSMCVEVCKNYFK